jgi:geranylgeranyl diphosphate synthase, type I
MSGSNQHEAIAYLHEKAELVEAALAEYWKAKRAELDEFPSLVKEVIEVYDGLTRGGKKLRAGLAILGYEACRHSGSPASTKEDGLPRAAAAVEILHNAFLIHDDIVDRSELRRGKPTVHRRYEEKFRSSFANDDDAAQYGAAIALNFGDQGEALGEQLLLSSGFPDHLLVHAVAQFGTTTAETVNGQILDLEHIKISDLTEQQVFRIHEFKTAHYTILLPLTLGATLADAPNEVLESIRLYAIPTGIAFQVQDDILGLFGEQEKLGKPVDSDLKEGKKTLLFVHAYQAASEEDRHFLDLIHGNPHATGDDLERVKQIVISTGARERSEQIAAELVQKAITSIPSLTVAPESQHRLRILAEYCISREG